MCRLKAHWNNKLVALFTDSVEVVRLNEEAVVLSSYQTSNEVLLLVSVIQTIVLAGDLACCEFNHVKLIA